MGSGSLIATELTHEHRTGSQSLVILPAVFSGRTSLPEFEVKQPDHVKHSHIFIIKVG